MEMQIIIVVIKMYVKPLEKSLSPLSSITPEIASPTPLADITESDPIREHNRM